MKIAIEKGSGFCFGVTRVIEMAEEILDKGQRLFCLGEIVHNEKEINRLVDKGMSFITIDQLEDLHDTTVMIRAHGEPPSSYELCKKNNIQIIDGTCPIVQSLQKKVRKAYRDEDSKGHKIVIYGKPEHPEVIGINGQTDNTCLVVSHPDQLDNEILPAKISLFSQTTMDSNGYLEIEERIREKTHGATGTELRFNNTICRHISHRQPGITEFAREHQLIVFVAGKNSSNGRILFEICKKANPHCIFISESEELKAEWFRDISTIGVTGGTSTPGWLLEQVSERIFDLAGRSDQKNTDS